MEKISIVVPCYNEQDSLPFFYKEINKVASEFENVDFEFIFINDGSNDNTIELIRNLSVNDNRCKYLSFSRNFGKEAGLLAGLEYSKGDYVAVMDADLQDPPELLKEMYESIKEENYDCVCTRRVTRKGEPPIRSFFARRFYKLINKMSDTEIVDGARDFRLMTRQMVNSILTLKERNRFSKGIFSYVGFNTKYIEFENVERAAGETKWSFFKLFLYSLEGIVAFSTAPLAFSTLIGIILCFGSFLGILIVIVRKLLTPAIAVDGWTSILVILLFFIGVQLLSIGVIGIYLSKTYLETKNRPIYIVKEHDKND